MRVTSEQSTTAARKLNRIGIVSTAARVFQAAAKALIVPLSIRILSRETFGYWLAIASFISWFSVSDFGIAQLSLAQIAACFGKNDKAGARHALGLAIKTYGALSMILLTGFAAISLGHVGSRFLSHSSPNSDLSAVDTCIAIVGVTFAISLSLNVAQILNTAGLRSEINYVVGSGGSLMSLVLLACAYLRSWNLSLPQYALMMTVPTAVVLAVVFVFTLFVKYRNILPDFSTGSLREAASLLHSSWPILVSQFGDVVLFFLPAVVIARAWGAREVVDYSFPASMFLFVVNLCYGWGQPHTAAYAQALERHEFSWIIRQHRTLLLRTVGIFAALSLLFAVAGRRVIEIYSGGKVHSSMQLLVCMAIFWTLVVASQQNYFLLLAIRMERVRAFIQIGNALFFLLGLYFGAVTHQLFLIPLVGSLGLIFDWLVATRATGRRLDEATSAQTVAAEAAIVLL